MRTNWELCMFSVIFMLNLMVLKWITVIFQPILALDIMNFLIWQNYWGGGQNDMFAPPPPQYFHWGGGGDCPPPCPPRIDASAPEQKTSNLRTFCLYIDFYVLCETPRLLNESCTWMKQTWQDYLVSSWIFTSTWFFSSGK